MSYNPDEGIRYEDVKRENRNELGFFTDLIDFNLNTQINSALERQLMINPNINKEQFRMQYRNELLKNFMEKQFSKGFRRLKVWLDLAYKIPPIFIDINGVNHTIKSLNIENSDSKYFALAGLMVVFQVFGDGNHRTAGEYFKKNTGKTLTEQELNIIKNINQRYDWYSIITNNFPPLKIDEIVYQLIENYELMNRNMRNNDFRRELNDGSGAGATPEIIRQTLEYQQQYKPIKRTRRGGKKTKKNRKTSKTLKTLKNKSKMKRSKMKKGKNTKISWDPNIISPVFFGYSLKK